MSNRYQSLSNGQREETIKLLNKRLFYYILTALALIGGVMGVGLWQMKQRLEAKMEVMISAQFEEPRIKQTVAEVASSKAEHLLVKEIQPEIDDFKSVISMKSKDVEAKIALIDEAVAKATFTVTELESVNEFMMTVLAAQNDDRIAFDRLEKWAKDEAHKFSMEASMAWVAIIDAHSGLSIKNPVKFEWEEGIDPSQMSFVELREHYRKQHVLLRPSLLDYIWNRQDISRLERLDFMMEVMKTDTSLRAVERAGRNFNKGAKAQLKPLAVSYLANWWLEHRHDFEEKQSQQLDSIEPR